MYKKFIAVSGTVACIIAFFAIAFTSLPGILKAVLMVAILLFNSWFLKKAFKLESMMGVMLLVRGRKGLNLMHFLGNKFPRIFKELADFGMTISFGIFYSIYIFKNDWRKILAHFALSIAIWYAILFLLIGQQLQAFPFKELVFFGCVAFGIVILGLASLLVSAFNILTTENAAPSVMPVIPGVTVPWEALIAIMIALVVHELAHGILAVAEKVTVKNSGLLLFGFLPVGAFVEPDEEEFKKAELQKKRRIVFAGVFSNFIFFVIFLLLSLAMSPLLASTVQGLEVVDVLNTSPSFGLLASGDVITAANGRPVVVNQDLTSALSGLSPNASVLLTVNGISKMFKLDEKGKIGIMASPKPFKGIEWLFSLLSFVLVVFVWTFNLNLALATINLLPLFFTDGYRLFFEELKEFASEKKAALLTNIASLALLLLLIFNLLPWFF